MRVLAHTRPPRAVRGSEAGGAASSERPHHGLWGFRPTPVSVLHVLHVLKPVLPRVLSDDVFGQVFRPEPDAFF